MNPQKPIAIFFDWDGTLADSFSFLEQAHNNVLISYGMEPFAPGAFRQYFGQPREKIYPALYADKAEEARERFEVFVHENNTKMLKPMNGAEVLLQSIDDMSIPMGIVTNKKRVFVDAEIDAFGWRKFFKTVVGARDAEQDKPAPDPLLLAVRNGSIEPRMSHIWLVGDTEADQMCAKTAGGYFVYLREGNPDKKMDIKSEEGQSLENCAALRDLLLQYG